MLTLFFYARCHSVVNRTPAIVRDWFRPRLVLQRAGRGHRLSLRWADRVLWVWLSQLWNGWRSALLIVKPETVIAWHRIGFRLHWKWKSRPAWAAQPHVQKFGILFVK